MNEGENASPQNQEMLPGDFTAGDCRQILMHANDAILVVDRTSGLILNANNRMCGLLCHTPQAVIGLACNAIFVAVQWVDDRLDKALGVSEYPRYPGINENMLRLADGQTIPVEINSSLVNLAAGKTVVFFVRDIGARVLAKANLSSTNALLAAISTLQSRFIGSVPMNTLFIEIVDSFMSLTGSEHAFLGEFFWTADGIQYFKVQTISNALRGAMAPEYYIRHAPIGLEFYHLDGALGAIVRSSTSIVFNDFLHCEVLHLLPEGHPPIHSFAGIPISSSGESLGFIGLANRSQGYDTELLDFLTPLIAVCGSLISAGRARLWREDAESELVRQSLVFNNISDAVILTNHAGTILDCNPASVAILGVPKKKLLGQPLDLVLSPAGNPAYPVRLAIAEVSRQGGWNGILELQRRDGNKSLWNTNVLPLKNEFVEHDDLVWFSNDITERQAAQAKLAKRTVELNTISELSPDGFVFIDRHGRITYVNPAFERMFGLRAELILGIGLCAFDEAMTEFCEVVCIKNAGVDDEAELLTLRRSRFTLLKRTQRILYDKIGVLAGTVQYYRDITQESEVDRMKSDFLSTAAHELRTPMASVFGFSELLLRREFDPVKQRKFIEIIHRQAGQLVSLVNELLDLARIEARAGNDFKIGHHDLASIIRSCAAEFYRQDVGQSLNVLLPKEMPRVLVDPDKLQLALGNVISNAVKYSMGRGPVDISISQREVEGRFQFGIVVRDQGIGMTPEQIHHIFERFYRADTSGKIPGTGLGMSIVKEVMAVFKGEVDVRSMIGEGCEVTLWIPEADGTAEA